MPKEKPAKFTFEGKRYAYVQRGRSGRRLDFDKTPQLATVVISPSSLGIDMEQLAELRDSYNQLYSEVTERLKKLLKYDHGMPAQTAAFVLACAKPYIAWFNTIESLELFCKKISESELKILLGEDPRVLSFHGSTEETI